MSAGGSSPAPGSSPLVWRSVLSEAVHRLGPGRAHEARWLVERASGYTGVEHVLHIDDPVATRHLAYFDQMIERRLAGEPLQYVLGRWQFRSLELVVDRRVLIPRPETEVVAGLAIAALQASAARRAADLGTGSGAIALSMLAEVPNASVWGTDVSSDALAVARANLAGVGGRAATRATLLKGPWYAALPVELMGTFDVIVSNPPYVAEGADLPAEVASWEPHGALFAGAEGLDDIEEIVAQASTWLVPDGTLVVELSPEQADWAMQLARSCGLTDVAVHPDLSGRARALVGRRPGPRAALRTSPPAPSR